MTARKLPDEVIERIKSEVSLVALAKSQGHELKKQGKDYVLSCPFHEDVVAAWRRLDDWQHYVSTIKNEHMHRINAG